MIDKIKCLNAQTHCLVQFSTQNLIFSEAIFKANSFRILKSFYCFSHWVNYMERFLIAFITMVFAFIEMLTNALLTLNILHQLNNRQNKVDEKRIPSDCTIPYQVRRNILYSNIMLALYLILAFSSNLKPIYLAFWTQSKVRFCLKHILFSV